MKANLKETAIAETTGEGSATYIWLDHNGKVSKTVNKSSWPVINVDYDSKGNLIGIEAVGLRGFTIETVLKMALEGY